MSTEPSWEDSFLEELAIRLEARGDLSLADHVRILGPTLHETVQQAAYEVALRHRAEVMTEVARVIVRSMKTE
jgi:hypothetical protein